MVTEKQVTAILVLAGAGIAFTFAIFNVYLAFKNSNSTYTLKKA